MEETDNLEEFDSTLTPEEEEELSDWVPESEEFQDFSGNDATRRKSSSRFSVLPSEFVNFAFRMPNPQKNEGFENFSFEGRRHMYLPYDTPSKRVLLIFSRQSEKSTLLGNKLITKACTIPNYKGLYVAPSATQTKVFSTDRIKEPLEISPVLKTYTKSMLSQNIFEKQFVNRSKIFLRYAFLTADRTRGVSVWDLLVDELQDILADNIPIIEQTTSHAPKELRSFCYAGTPKSLDNPIEYYRSGVTKDGKSMSTQNEWVIPCDFCGSSDGAGRYWNVLCEKNIGLKSLICGKCGKPLNPQHPDAQWAKMVDDGVFESFHISQLMVPWRPWEEIILDYSRYGRAQFYNEVLGMSYDSGLRPINIQQIKDCCNPEVTMDKEALEYVRKHMPGAGIFAGIDWGSAENSYTVMSLAHYTGNKFRVFFIHRFTGQDAEPDIQVEKIKKIVHAFQVKVVATDYGGGFVQNNDLIKRFGPQRVFRYQYMAKCPKKVAWSPKLNRYAVHRTEVMSDIFAAIKRGNVFEFPRWEEFQEPYAKDMLNIYSEYNSRTSMMQYSHRPDCPDDAFHSVLYCFLGSMQVFSRPDIITPRRAFKNQEVVIGNPHTNVYQG